MPETSPFVHRLGRLLRERRGERTQGEIAGAAGISNRSLSDYECGTTLPSLDMVVRLFDVLGIEADELLALIIDGDNDDEPNGARAAA